MNISRDRLINLLKIYMNDKNTTATALADLILLEDAKEKQLQDDLTDHMMWGTD